jgi:hypothetical protein
VFEDNLKQLIGSQQLTKSLIQYEISVLAALHF